MKDDDQADLDAFFALHPKAVISLIPDEGEEYWDAEEEEWMPDETDSAIVNESNNPEPDDEVL